MNQNNVFGRVWCGAFRSRLASPLATAGHCRRTRPPAANSTATLNLPQNPQLFGTPLPSVVKATAIVNGEVITQTDIDQRLALLAIANNTPDPGRRGRSAAPAGAEQPHRRDAADPGRQGRGNRNHRCRCRQDRRTRRRQRQADAGADGRLSEVARLLDPFDPPPDHGRNRLAPAAVEEDRERGQRRRRGSPGGHRQAQRLQGRRGIPRRRDFHFGQQRQ